MDPLQQAPIMTKSTGTPSPKSSMGKTITIAIVAIILIILAIVLAKGFMNKSKGGSAETKAAFTELQKENGKEDFTDIDSDFGAEVNTAAQ